MLPDVRPATPSVTDDLNQTIHRPDLHSLPCSIKAFRETSFLHVTVSDCDRTDVDQMAN